MSKPVACGACGALNDDSFDSCIRCGGELTDATEAHKAVKRRVVPDPVKRPRRVAARQQNAPGLFGRWPSHMLLGTKVIICLNALVFMAQTSAALQRAPGFSTAISGGSSIDAFVYGAFRAPGLELLLMEPWRLLAACYVHFGIIHFGMNMSALIQLGRLLEPQIGSDRFVISYTLAGIAGFVVCAVSYQVLGIQPSMTAGASGAVFGVLGLLLGVALRRDDVAEAKKWALYGIGGVVVMSLLPNINNAAHFGGLVAGVIIGRLSGPGENKVANWQKAASAVCLLLALGSVIASRLSPLSQYVLANVG